MDNCEEWYISVQHAVVGSVVPKANGSADPYITNHSGLPVGAV